MTVGAGGGGSAGQQPKFEQVEQVDASALRQLKDFVGASVSEDMARKALLASKTSTGNFNVEFAANWLLDRSITSGNQNPTNPGTARLSPNATADGSKTSPKTPLKDAEQPKGQTDGRQKTLSVSEDTELQKAIALSLSDQHPQTAHQQQTPLGLGGQISAEEQELSKVIEASIAESKKGAGHDLRQSSLFFVDPANPHERERQGIWPVGLKNVGNTCWFSVVIQALFHLPIFRRRLLNYDLDAALRKCTPPAEAAASSSSPSTLTLPRELEFIIELRKLFALLLGSRRKYVDPSAAVEVLRKQDSLQLRNIGGLDSGQQDVSEFTHLLLEWLEESFKFTLPAADNVGATSGTKKSPREAHEEAGTQKMEVDTISPRDNAIEQLFYGTFITESVVDMATPSAVNGTATPQKNENGDDASTGLDVQVVPTKKEERFSQYPLQVVGCETLHDSMEKSLRPEESPEVENWLEQLPSVFLFELSRFRYNQTDKKPEKIHSQFRFPKVLFVDRYLRANKVAIREKRKQVGRLRQQLNTLKYELEKLENFRGSKMPLSNVLALTLDFLGRGDSPQSISCDTEPMDGCEPNNGDAATGDAGTLLQPFSRRATDVSDADLGVIDRCLSRWRAMVLEHVEQLKKQIAEVETQIEGVYCEPGFQQHPYALHAVLVHEGQATVGHYWTFIADAKSMSWRKYNDVQVTEVPFDEIERDSFGGHQNTSAYCLVYVDARRSDLFENLENITETQLVASLPPDLQRLVSEDNARFITELNEWDRKHTAATTPSAPNPSPTGVIPSTLQRNLAQTVINETELTALVEEHSRLATRQVKAYVQEQLVALAQSGMMGSLATPEALLQKLIEEKTATTKKEVDEFLAKIGFTDNGTTPKWHACTDVRRNQPLPFYAQCWLRCGGGRRFTPFDEASVFHRIMLDFFANPGIIGQNNEDTVTAVYQAAKRSIASSGVLAPNDLQVYARIYYDFKSYLETLVLLTHTVDKLHEGAYTLAFHAIICTKTYADRLFTQSSGAGGVDEEFVLELFKKIVMHVSEQTLKEIMAAMKDEDVVEKVKQMKAQLLPCLIELNQQYNDSETLESIRAGWLAAVLDEQDTLPKSKLRELNDFLEALMEVEATTLDGRNSRPGMNARIKLQSDIGPRFGATLKLAQEHNILNCHHTARTNETNASRQ